ncbi:MAG: response regulator [Candidatus Kapaibacteriota bacterium]
MPSDKLLLIDDDFMLVKLYKKYFEKHFDVTTANSAEQAYEILNKGYVPEVVLSDNLMPGENGADLLNKLSITHPNCIRILMTAETDTKTLIQSVNYAKAFMFLTKPIREIDLIQAVNIAFKYYKCKTSKVITQSTSTNKNIIKEQSKNNDIITKQPDSITPMLDTFIKVGAFKGNYYYNHFKGILTLGKYFVDELKLLPESNQRLFKIELYYSLMMNTFPIRLAYKIPFDLQDVDKKEYFKKFDDFIKLLIENKSINENDQITQIWETFDGNGYPAQIKGTKISIESQIFLLSNLYFHNVYELPNESLIDKFNPQTYTYRYEVAMDKMKQAQKYLFEHQKWFNPDLFNIFRYAIKDNKVDEFLPIRENKTFENQFYIPEFEILMNEVEEIREAAKEAPEIVTEDGGSYELKSIPVTHLAIGMIINQNIYTNNGIAVAKIGTIITGNLLNNIITLFEKKQLKDIKTIDVKIPI